MTSDILDKKIGGYTPSPTCNTTHPVLKVGNGTIVGASCGAPRDGFDIYIGFCTTMKFQHQLFPWDTKDDSIIEFQYTITDMCAPKSPKEFANMVDWVAGQLDDGKSIHVGCIGGHGRTGTFLAALVSKYENLTDDPIQWVRENHCKRGVESESQVKFLVKHFGCKTAKPTKQSHHGGTETGRFWGGTGAVSHHKRGSAYRKPKGNEVPLSDRIRYVAKKGSIWC